MWVSKVALTVEGRNARLRVAAILVLAVLIGVAALVGLLRPSSNGCVMTYMYPTYIPISFRETESNARYALYKYHEGWRRIDYKNHLKSLSGVPVLFIPGNSGSYKQVRSIAAESDRAYKGGPLERTFYQEAYLTPEEGGVDKDLIGFQIPDKYSNKLDWFAVDLEGEHSAMDGQVLEEHTNFVVKSVHRILDQYKESRDARDKEGAASSRNLPASVILVGHSVGGFVARAAVIHPHLRKSTIETIITLSSPHQSPPLALQPSLGNYYARINEEWRKGYEVVTTQAGHYVSDPLLSRVVVISISGGSSDFQVRSKLQSLDGIVPPTNGFMIGSTGMKNVWLSMEHQAILWCNQLVMQVSHTMLSLVDPKTSQPFDTTQKRLAVFTKMLQSGVSQSFDWATPSQLSPVSTLISAKDAKDVAGTQKHVPPCPSDWSDDALEQDLYIETTTITVLAMDGRRRWLDIQKLGSDGKSHFVFVTNLAPCLGVRIHLWPEKDDTNVEVPVCPRISDVTSKMVLIPAGPAPSQMEPGSQTEQAPPSSIFRLEPEEMSGFRYITISVAPRLTVPGRPPPAISMGVGQFFDPQNGEIEFSAQSMLLSAYSRKEVFLEEDHPLVLNLSFGVSLGIFPVTLSLNTVGCGIKSSELQDKASGDLDNSGLCKLRCFPPIALAWDPTSGLHIFPNIYSGTLVVDGSPVLWSHTPGSEKTSVMLLADPHCSYKTSIQVSVTATASRFMLLYVSKIAGLSIAVIFFALMRQANEWDCKLSVPSMLAAVEYNLRLPFPFLLLAILPIFASLFFSLLMSQPLPPFASFTVVSLVCYVFANGFTVLLILISQLFFYLGAVVHTSIKARWQLRETNRLSRMLSLTVTRILRVNTFLVTALAAILLVSLVHPVLGLFIILLSHAFCCHNSMCSILMASRKKEFLHHINEADCKAQNSSEYDSKLRLDSNTSSNPNSPKKCFGDTQVETFNHKHGMLVLHLAATAMFVPSLIAWWQVQTRIGMPYSFPWLLDSSLCIGVILAGVFNSKPESNLWFSLPPILGQEVSPQHIYALAGYYSYFSGLSLAPYRVFYAMAAIGYMSAVLKILERNKGVPRVRSKKHLHRH